jgi:hypothetical protein
LSELYLLIYVIIYI